jgi:hypothetical protein
MSDGITFTIGASTTTFTTSQVATAVYNVLVANGYSVSTEHVLVTVCNTNLFCVTILLPNTSGRRRLQTIVMSELVTFLDSTEFTDEVETELGDDITVSDVTSSSVIVRAPPPSPPPPSPPQLPPPPLPPFSPGGGIWGDPHIHFAHGGYADFRGINNTLFAMLSAPGVQFAVRTMDTVFLLPRPQLVHGSFFTEASWIVRGETSGKLYGIIAKSDNVGFQVFDIKTNTLVASKQGIWQQWWVDGIRAYSKQATVYVRSSGWEVNVTRQPIYNYISGPSHWRFDISMRKLDNTFFSRYHGKSSSTCYPHGILGQSWDGDNIAVDGKTDSYKYQASNPIITTTAQAEGAIEGVAKEYIVKSLRDPYFKYTRFYNFHNDTCDQRNVEGLSGTHREVRHVAEIATTDDNEGNNVK